MLARGPSQQAGPVIAPAELHISVCSHASLQGYGAPRRVFEPVPGGSVAKKKAGKDGGCLLTWSRSLGVVTNCSDWGDCDSVEPGGESEVD